MNDNHDLLPTGSEERGVLGMGSIPVAILPSWQDIKTDFITITFTLIWLCSKNKKHLRSISQPRLRPQYTPWPSLLLSPSYYLISVSYIKVLK